MKIDINRRAKLSTIIYLLLTGIGVGGLFGAITNMINGKVSPLYFRIILGWEFEGIWYAAVSQGIYEGLIYGTIYSSLYSIAFAFLIRKRVSYLWAITSYSPILLTLTICWILGGACAILLAEVNPELYRHWFPIAPEGHKELLKFSWVRGSIWGGIGGGLFSIIYGAISLKRKWEEILDLENGIINITENYS